MILTFWGVAKGRKRVRDGWVQAEMDKEIEGEKIESWESCDAEEYTHTKCQQKRRAQTKHLNQSATKRWSITTMTMLQSRRGPDLSGTADRAGQAALALRDSHSPLLSHLFVFSLPLCPSSLTALCLPPLLYLAQSPSFHFDYSLPLHLLAPTSSSILPIFLSGTHHLSSVVSLPPPTPPTHFHSLNPIQGVLLAS